MVLENLGIESWSATNTFVTKKFRKRAFTLIFYWFTSCMELYISKIRNYNSQYLPHCYTRLHIQKNSETLYWHCVIWTIANFFCNVIYLWWFSCFFLALILSFKPLLFFHNCTLLGLLYFFSHAFLASLTLFSAPSHSFYNHVFGFFSQTFLTFDPFFHNLFVRFLSFFCIPIVYL